MLNINYSPEYTVIVLVFFFSSSWMLERNSTGFDHILRNNMSFKMIMAIG